MFPGFPFRQARVTPWPRTKKNRNKTRKRADSRVTPSPGLAPRRCCGTRSPRASHRRWRRRRGTRPASSRRGPCGSPKERKKGKTAACGYCPTLGQHQWYHFGVGEFTTHFSLFEWGWMLTGGTIWILTHGQMGILKWWTFFPHKKRGPFAVRLDRQVQSE